MQTRILSTEDPQALPAALELLSSGRLVAFPTDTVYGLAANLFDEGSIAQLYAVKERSASKAIAVLIGEIGQLAMVTPGLTPSAKILADLFWPGGLTLVVPKHSALPAGLSPLPTVGVRMPDHAFARALLRAAGPLATTSANISGESNTLTAQQVLAQLDGRVALILDGGPVVGGVPSTVVDCTRDVPQVLREGALTEAVLFDALRENGIRF